MAWKSMASAPKNGTKVLLKLPDRKEPTLAWWKECNDYCPETGCVIGVSESWDWIGRKSSEIEPEAWQEYVEKLPE